MDTGSSFPGEKSVRGVKLITLSTTVEVNKTWIYTSTSPYVFMA
jgi:hypothetical protein